MLQFKHLKVVELCNISSDPTAFLLILIWVSDLVRPISHILVILVRRLGIILDHQSRATLQQYLGQDYIGRGCYSLSRFY